MKKNAQPAPALAPKYSVTLCDEVDCPVHGANECEVATECNKKLAAENAALRELVEAFRKEREEKTDSLDILIAEARAQRDHAEKLLAARNSDVDQLRERLEAAERELGEALSVEGTRPQWRGLLNMVRAQCEFGQVVDEENVELTERAEQAERGCAELHSKLRGAQHAVDDAVAVNVVLTEKLAAYESAIDRLTTVVDEACGMQPVMSPDELVTVIERHVHDQRLRLAAYEREAKAWEVIERWRVSCAGSDEFELTHNGEWRIMARDWRPKVPKKFDAHSNDRRELIEKAAAWCESQLTKESADDKA